MSMMSIIDASSMMRISQSRGECSCFWNPPLRGLNSRRRWIVLASQPVASAIFFAARPVGAARRIFVRTVP